MRSERRQPICRVLLFALAFLFVFPVSQGLGYAAERKTPRPAEYAVKAAFVYNFVKFVDWPGEDGMPGDTVRICVLGDVDDAGAFADLQGQEVRGRRLDVSMIREERDADGCGVLFVAANQSPNLQNILDRLDGTPTLTVGDTEGYAQRGIMINLFLENRRVRFEINADRARASGLQISTKLLKLASKVYSAGP